MENAQYQCTKCNQRFWTQQMRDTHSETCQPKIDAPTADDSLLVTCANEGCGLQVGRSRWVRHSDACRGRTVLQRQRRRLETEKTRHDRHREAQAAELGNMFPCDKCGAVEATALLLAVRKLYCNRPASGYRCRKCGEERSNAVLLQAHEIHCYGSSSASTSAAGHRCDGCGIEHDTLAALNLHKIYCPARSR